jgi:hypothetical protein
MALNDKIASDAKIFFLAFLGPNFSLANYSCAANTHLVHLDEVDVAVSMLLGPLHSEDFVAVFHTISNAPCIQRRVCATLRMSIGLRSVISPNIFVYAHQNSSSFESPETAKEMGKPEDLASVGILRDLIILAGQANQ